MTSLPIMPAFPEHKTAITLQSSDGYTVYTAATLQSLLDNTNTNSKYDILLMVWDMSEEHAKKIVSLSEGRDNVSIRIVNIWDMLKKHKTLVSKMLGDIRFAISGPIRLLFPELLENYDYTINVDCDMIFKADIAELYNVDVSEYYLAAAPDTQGYASYYNGDEYLCEDTIKNVFRLNSIDEYVNCGLFIMNLAAVKRDFTIEQLAEFCSNKKILYNDQDTFNHFFRGRIFRLGFEWNWQSDARLIIEKSKKTVPADDWVLKEHYKAEPAKKVIHYNTGLKPWRSPGIAYGSDWWEAAAHSPFLGEILGNITRIENPEVAKRPTGRLLFVCETVFNLLNAISLKYHYYPDNPADIILTSTSNLTSYEDKLKSTGVFDRIYCTEYFVKIHNPIILAKPIEMRSRHPEKFDFMPKLDAEYSDYFMPNAASIFQKMVYYYQVNRGNTPRVHLYDDYEQKYTSNFISDFDYEMNNATHPKEKRIWNNVSSFFIYKPELCCNANKTPLIPMPKVTADDTKFLSILTALFGKCEMPKEKYIFFNECFIFENHITDDIELLDAIAQKVGKENIIVKMHPRSGGGEDFYRLHGYKIFAEKNIPWEVYAMSPEIEDKVLVSVTSGSTMSPFLLMDKQVYSISLMKLMKLSKRFHAKKPLYRKFFFKALEATNRVNTVSFCPDTKAELNYILDYIEGEM